MPISLKNVASIFPYVRYSPQANTMSVAGDDNKPHEIPFIGKNLAIDIENGTPGWLLIDKGVRDWKPFPLHSVAPPSPGPNYKRGFAVWVFAPKLLGSAEPHEMCSSTGAHLSFCERVYNECEPNLGQGNVPIIKITKAKAIPVGKGKSRELHFEIVKWVPRPAAFVDALAKLKAAADGSDKHGRPDDTADDFDDDTAPADDFANDDDDVTADPKPKTEATAEKSSTRRRKKEPPPPPPPSMSDILNDDLPDSLK